MQCVHTKKTCSHPKRLPNTGEVGGSPQTSLSFRDGLPTRCFGKTVQAEMGLVYVFWPSYISPA